MVKPALENHPARRMPPSPVRGARSSPKPADEPRVGQVSFHADTWQGPAPAPTRPPPSTHTRPLSTMPAAPRGAPPRGSSQTLHLPQTPHVGVSMVVGAPPGILKQIFCNKWLILNPSLKYIELWRWCRLKKEKKKNHKALALRSP